MQYNTFISDDTIAANATGGGASAIAIIRISGKKTAEIADKFFVAVNGKKVKSCNGYTILYGKIIDKATMIDEALLTYFKAPHSFTGEDTVEISCHGSKYIQNKIMHLLIQNGVRPAKAGEFSKRSFLNGKRDLSQTEAIADLIAAESNSAHQTALNQMRGGFSKKIQAFRKSLIDFASLLELELDFSEEDVEFANRSQLLNAIESLMEEITLLTQTYQHGQIIKEGIPIAIIGRPNAGKSTLLNTILQDERAIVSNIEGTTRDTIEEKIDINGLQYRFIDTAGIRNTTNQIEKIGIERAFSSAQKAAVIFALADLKKDSFESFQKLIAKIKNNNLHSTQFFYIGNKKDTVEEKIQQQWQEKFPKMLLIDARQKTYLKKITNQLTEWFAKFDYANATIVTNLRHYHALVNTSKALQQVKNGLLEQTSTDLIALDLRAALDHLGSITGQVSSNDILHNVFANFCIGK